MNIKKFNNNNELKCIFNQMILEKETIEPFPSIKLLCNYLNKNRTYSDEIIKNIHFFLIQMIKFQI